MPDGRRPTGPRATVHALADELHRRGLERLYVRACPGVGLLSVATGLTVWSDGRTLRWQENGRTAIWPANDAAGAALWLAGLARQLANTPVRPEVTCAATGDDG